MLRVHVRGWEEPHGLETESDLRLIQGSTGVSFTLAGGVWAVLPLEVTGASGYSPCDHAARALITIIWHQGDLPCPALNPERTTVTQPRHGH